MKIIIFIGHHKVGSTSLQTYLALNYYRLLKQGILYPSVLGPNRTLDFKAWAARRLGIGPVPMGIREGHNALVYRMKSDATGKGLPDWFRGMPASETMFRTISDQVAHHQPETLVLCAEAFSDFANHGDQLMQQLLEFCGPSDIQIMCTLRRPDEYLTSWHLQLHKISGSLKPLRGAGLADYLEGTHFDYAHMLGPWIEAFGQSRVSLSNYAQTLKAGGSIQNFWQVSGLSEPQGAKAVPRTNPSVPCATSEIVRRASFVLSHAHRQMFWRWMVAQHKTFGALPNGEIEMFGPENRAVMVERFEAAHRYISEISGQQPFFPDIDRMTEVKPVSDVDAAGRVLPEVRRQAQKAGLPEEITSFLADLEL